MRQMLLALILMLTVGAAAANENRYREQAARNAIIEMFESMESVRAEAMATGGLARALEACKTIIPQMAVARRAAMDTIDVSRISLHVLNPANALDAWERRILETFAARAARGEDLKTMEHSEAIEIDGGARMFRFMSAFVADSSCLACHGNAATPEITGQRAKLFPQGQAAPWSPGGLAGAFSIRQPM